jgi:hypothetical protein
MGAITMGGAHGATGTHARVSTGISLRVPFTPRHCGAPATECHSGALVAPAEVSPVCVGGRHEQSPGSGFGGEFDERSESPPRSRPRSGPEVDQTSGGRY